MSCPMCEDKKLIPRTEEEKKKLDNRINRIIGSLNGIKNMIDTDRYCDDVLIQLAAVDKSIKSLANNILDDHMHSCFKENMEKGNYEVIDEVVDLFKRFQ